MLEKKISIFCIIISLTFITFNTCRDCKGGPCPEYFEWVYYADSVEDFYIDKYIERDNLVIAYALDNNKESIIKLILVNYNDPNDRWYIDRFEEGYYTESQLELLDVVYDNDYVYLKLNNLTDDSNKILIINDQQNMDEYVENKIEAHQDGNILIKDNYLFYRDGNNINIADISDVGNITIVNTIEDIPVYDMKIVGNKLYATMKTDGFYIIDISDVTNTSILGWQTNNTELNTYAIDADEQYCYYPINTMGVFLMDITYPADIKDGGQLKLPPWFDNITDVIVYGDYLYVACGKEGLVVADISNPAFPEKVKEIPNAVYVDNFQIVDNYLYASFSGPGLLIYKIADPANPSGGMVYF